MTGFSRRLSIAPTLLALVACGAAPAPPPARPVTAEAPREQLSYLFARYWGEHLPLDNAISPQYLADSREVEQRYLSAALNAGRDRLDANAKLSYDIFVEQRQMIIEGLTFPSELLAVNPFGGMPQQFAALAADTLHSPPATAADYADWLRRIDEYVRWTQQAISNLRDGVRRGYTMPSSLCERMLPILEHLGEDNAANVFYVPVNSMPQTIKDPDRTRLAMSLTAAIRERLLPANRALHDFLQHEYLPRSRAGLALSELPLGAGWYAYRVKRATSSQLSPDEIHRIGIAEVDRLHRLQSPRDAAPHDEVSQGAQPATALEPVSAYRQLAAQVSAAMAPLFSQIPNSGLEMRATAWLGLPPSPLYYQSSGPNGTPPAILYVNTVKPAAGSSVSISDFLQQAEPGHYYQMTLQQQTDDLPRFRRFGSEPAFVEGWGLYAASLGQELGVYTDDAAKAEALTGQIRCAAALVVDTGLHAQGWTRQQALDYLHVQMVIADSDAQSLIDEYAANPADALACKMGELRFQALRVRTQQALGGRFDIREFHAEILKDGAMPLDLLEAKMKLWTEMSR